jgi:hypothetical protein
MQYTALETITDEQGYFDTGHYAQYFWSLA